MRVERGLEGVDLNEPSMNPLSTLIQPSMNPLYTPNKYRTKICDILTKKWRRSESHVSLSTRSFHTSGSIKSRI